jgi:predicted hydrocarbon binding protein
VNDAGPAVSNAHLRRVLLGIQDVMGTTGLATILRQAGQIRYANTLPPDDSNPALPAAEYAALLQAIENYYGRGARGTLMRIGAASFNALVKSRPLARALYATLGRLLPVRQKRAWAVRWLAREMGGHVTVEATRWQLKLIDLTSAATMGRQRDVEICWLTQGEIMEALKWVTGREHEVAETACKARGDPACRFEIGEPL